MAAAGKFRDDLVCSIIAKEEDVKAGCGI